MTIAGAVLAGGRGRRMAALGPKPGVPVAGRPLVQWPLAALRECCAPVAVVCKAGTALPVLPEGVERWDEPEGAFHPAVGLLAGLERAVGDVLVCAADMPLLDAATCSAVLAAARDAPGAAAVIAWAGGRVQPLLGIYRQAAMEGLRAVLPDGRLVAAVEALDPVLVEVGERSVLSVDTPESLAEAERLLLSS